MASINIKPEINSQKKMRRHAFSGILLLSFLAISQFSCTDIAGDGIDTVVWEGATLPEESSYRNPIWEPDLSNPSVFRGATQFYAFGDEKEWAPGLNYVVPVLRSSNLMNWSISGEAFATRPAWAEGSISSVSAVFSKTLSTYYLTYTIADAGIGVAYSKAPQGPYIDYGKLFDPATLGFTSCNEPYFIQAGLKFYLFFKTNDGIYGTEMTVVKNTIPTLKGSLIKIAGSEFSGACIYRKASDSYYFFGNTGGEENGSVSVARAAVITGPYLDKNGNDILSGVGTELITGSSADGLVSPSKVGGVFADFEGTDWIIYQVTDIKKPLLGTGQERHPIMLNKIEMDSEGWPLDVIQATTGWHQPKFQLSE